jgi:hypothetical protein
MSGTTRTAAYVMATAAFGLLGQLVVLLAGPGSPEYGWHVVFGAVFGALLVLGVVLYLRARRGS